ncbi:unnamed protein product, partial [Strongylus vulgaris]
MLSECIDQIDSASAYAVTECYLLIARHLLGKSFCEELLELARLNTPVALHLSTALLRAEQMDLLGNGWAYTIFSVAVFGPIPKKESRVVNAAYEMISTEISNQLGDIHRPFEVVQRTRLNGVLAAVKLSRKDPRFASHLVDIIITETNCMNLSSS